MKLTIIVPCYNEQEALPLFYQEVTKVLKTMDCEYDLLFVNDGSRDGTLDVMRGLAKQDSHVTYLSFSRNFGKEAAMYAGFCNARKGDFVTVMDADLQHPPALLPQMLQLLTQDDKYDCISTRRISRRGEPRVRSWLSLRFYRFFSAVLNIESMDGSGDFRLMRREMVDAIVSMGEYNRFSKGIFGWIGFRTYCLPYENVDRVAGKTKWNLWKLFKYALDGIVNFSQAPLSIASWMGISMTFCSIIALIYIVLRKLIQGDPVAGWASTICVIIFIGGIQLFCLGIMGQYIARTYMETKQRPHYIISESNREDIERIG